MSEAWSVYPFNPAVVTLTIPLGPAPGSGPFRTQKMSLALEVE